ncbi:MAG TPA: hypothetical protein VIM30_08530 [Candidatus Limnocylindrales bacterium]
MSVGSLTALGVELTIVETSTSPFPPRAAYAPPLILLASNQSTVRDRATLEHAADESEDADKKGAEILARLTRIEVILTEWAGSKS